MPGSSVSSTKISADFWTLAAFLLLIFLTGGSSRADVATLEVLRPVAVLVAAYGLFTMQREQWRRYRHLIYIMVAVLALTAIHLAPLPPAVWHALPGRDVIREIDALIGLHDQWRPLSMVPSGTLNALCSLSVPIAVFTLVVKLRYEEHVRLMVLLIGLVIVSGAVGLAQAIGVDLKVYELSSANPGLFANRNHQGILLALLFPMLVVLANRADPIIDRRAATILAFGIALINLPLVVVTGSRAGLLGSLLAIALVPFVRAGAGKPSQSSRLALLGKYAAALVIVATLVLATVFASRDTALSRLDNADNDARYPVWESIVRILPEYLPWGSGVGSYADVYQIREPDALLRPTFSNHAHNELLEIAFTAGLPGLILLGWASILFAYAIRRNFRASRRDDVFGRLGLCMVGLLVFASVFDYPIRTPIMASVLVIAAVWACSVNTSRNEDGHR